MTNFIPMRLDGNKIIPGTERCYNCNEGKITSPVSCMTCNGTGKGVRGGKGGCKKCYGSGNVYAYIGVKCPKCNATGIQPHTPSSPLARDIFNTIPIRVIASDWAVTWNESNLGFGCIYSSSGSSGPAIDDQAAWENEVRRDAHSLLTKDVIKGIDPVTGEINWTIDPNVHIVVISKRNGFSVRLSRDKDSLDAMIRAALELPTAAALRTAMQVCEDGGNGTAAAVYGTTERLERILDSLG